jgi:hypothetical protein
MIPTKTTTTTITSATTVPPCCSGRWPPRLATAKEGAGPPASQPRIGPALAAFVPLPLPSKRTMPEKKKK